MCVLMGYVGVLADVHKAVVEACLLGDVLWMVPFVRLVSDRTPLMMANATRSPHFVWLTALTPGFIVLPR
jgi:hypothetical protein